MFDNLDLLGIALCCGAAAFLIGSAMFGLGCRMDEW